MASQLAIFTPGGVDPYVNLAREECLLDFAAEGAVALCLWRNERTVVIGRNQNASDECDLAALEADGGRLARRLSGGGAVYHDLGNLNFTFAVPADGWDLGLQTETILGALARLGIAAERNGRNDLTVDGRKFSGHAYYHRGDASYHHGTLMVDVDTGPLSRYLRPSPLKFAGKGVASVRSRVMNLAEAEPSLTTGKLAEALAQSFAQAYGGEPQVLDDEALGADVLAERAERMRSRAWLLRESDPLENSRMARFGWGTVRFDWSAEGGRIVRAALWSDGLDADLIEAIPAALERISATAEGIRARLACLGAPSGMAHDIASLIGE